MKKMSACCGLDCGKCDARIATITNDDPELEDTCDTVLSLLSGSFALLAVGFVWAKELIGRKKAGKDGGGEA